ncbi:MAG TPA: hypothetical protein PLC99_14990 [Verrucomicrobiota bacterium]|nr:hypothetical protein [Verrucomicrobiota bacterium]
MKFQKNETIVRDDCQFPTGALVVDGQDAAGNLLAHPLGGGFQLTIPVSDLGRFRVVPVEDQQARVYRAGVFCLEGEDSQFQGWTKGELWNGWATPCFELEVAHKVAAMVPGSRLDSARDAFVTRNQEEELWQGQSIVTTDGRLLKVYPIGACAWCWDECPNQ